MFDRLQPWFILAAVLLPDSTTYAVDVRDSTAVDFQKDIRPILSDKCFQCHGPDENTREADLRLDLPEAAYSDLGGYVAIAPDNSAESEVVRRIQSEDEYERMPPEDSGKHLTAGQIALLSRWIDSGAEYQEHWAFVPPLRPKLPPVEMDSWPKNEIDIFVLQRLEDLGLQQSAEADRFELVRRVYLDLIGLPPTIEQADAFVNDRRPDAYENLVDELLGSLHYGERWARRWLDLARYSDTKGYEKDQPRTMWLYRDWVINALNNDMPFDKFTIEQIAGDMLPDASIDQLIATGFHRNTMTNEEGGIDPQEFRFLSVVDRVATTGATWLGLTLGCAQCHTHKFDPISHTEYYRLFAFLNNADEPKIEVPQDERSSQRQKIEAEIDALVAELPNRFSANGKSSEASSAPISDTDLDRSFNHWIEQQRQRVVQWNPLEPQHVESNLPITTILEDGSILCSGDITKNDVFAVTYKPKLPTITAIRLETLPHPSLPGGGPGRQLFNEGQAREGSFFLSDIKAWLSSNASCEKNSERSLAWKKATVSYAPPEIEAEFIIDGKHDTGWVIFGREGERHTAVLTFAEPVAVSPDQGLVIQLSHESYYPAGMGRFRISETADLENLQATGFTEEIALALQKPVEELTTGQRQLLLREFLMSRPKLSDQHQQIAELKKRLPEQPTALVFQERQPKHKRITHRHHRGEFLQPKEVVEPGVPEVLHDFLAGEEINRLTFAKWLIDRQNPLVARVVMNRQWEALFGLGLVRTTEDFGYQGAFPSHSELLDWLAVEFMDSGWSLKKMHKLIVMSATYRQTSQASAEKFREDPDNELLARGPGHRIEAELLRDLVLTSSGLLCKKIGGPSVFPPQPPGITEAAYGSLSWTVSQGEDRYRRGLYTFNKRTAPYAMFGLFDAPSGEVCVPRRNRSNTPLQSLAMLNDEVVLEAARHMAGESMQAHAGDRRSIATDLFRRCVTRPPTNEELESILFYFKQQLEHMKSGAASAMEILRAGPTTEWTFRSDSAGWEAQNQCQIELEHDSLVVISEGDDPFIGTSVTSPAGLHSIHLRAHFDMPGNVEIFWTSSKHSEESADRKIAIEIVPNKWHDYSARFDVDGELRSLRIDPGQSAGIAKFEKIRLSVGDGLYEVTEEIDPSEFVAWMLTSRVLLNLDETITKP